MCNFCLTAKQSQASYEYFLYIIDIYFDLATGGQREAKENQNTLTSPSGELCIAFIWLRHF